METQICSACKKNKLISDFYFHQGHPRKRCKICWRGYNTSEKRKQYNHTYYQLNKESLISYQKEYRRKHRSNIPTNRWTNEEIELLKKYYPIGGGVECRKHINRKLTHINEKATRMNLTNPYIWTDSQINLLKLNYYEHGAKFCATLIKKSICAIISKARKMGIKNKKSCLQLPDGRRICSVCGQTKPLTDFAKDGTRTRADCKICNSSKTRNYQNHHKQQVREKNRKWREINKEYLQEYHQQRRPRERMLSKKRYHERLEVREKLIQSSKDYRRDPKNKSTIRATQARLTKGYMKNPAYRALQNLRRRLIFVLEGKRKAAHSIEMIGCDREGLKKHLESLFTKGMTWENYGIHGWHIDHKIPCASFDLSKPDEQKKCFHFTNLQPLWAKDNLSKGDKII